MVLLELGRFVVSSKFDFMKDKDIKSVRTAYLFWLVGLFGCLGVHRRYLGKRRTARLWLCTAGVLGRRPPARLLVRHHNRRAGLRTLHRRLEERVRRKREAVEAQRYEEAAGLRDREVVLQHYIKTLRKELGAA